MGGEFMRVIQRMAWIAVFAQLSGALSLSQPVSLQALVTLPRRL
jgi:hypothetical protein